MSEHACELKPHLGGIVQPVGDGLWIHEIDFVSQAVPTITELAANGAMLSRSNSHVLGPKILIAGDGWGRVGFLASWLYEPWEKLLGSQGKAPSPTEPEVQSMEFPEDSGAEAERSCGSGRWALELRASGFLGFRVSGF